MSLIAHWPLNGHARDIVSGHDGVLSGPGLTWVDSHTGGGLSFSHGYDKVTIPHDEELSNKFFGKTDILSISFKIFVEDLINYGCVIAKAIDGSWSNTTTGVWVYSAGIRFLLGEGVAGNSSGSYVYVDGLPPMRRWVHVVCVSDGTDIEMWFDGVSQGKSALSGLTRERVLNEGDVLMGPRHPGTSSSLRARISDLKLFDHVLSPYERKALGISPISHWPLIYQPVNGEVGGMSYNEGEATIHGGAYLQTRMKGKIRECIRFNGAPGEHIKLPMEDFFQNKDYGTVSMFFKLNSLINDANWLWFCNVERDKGLQINPAGYVGMRFNGDDTNARDPISNVKVTLGKWHHIAMTWNKSSGLIKLYLDGVEIISNQSGGWGDINNGTGVLLGAGATFATSIDGHLAHFKTFGTVLELNEIKFLGSKQLLLGSDGIINAERIEEGRDRIAATGEFLMAKDSEYGGISVAAYEDGTDLFVEEELVSTLSAGEIFNIPVSMMKLGGSITAHGKSISIGHEKNAVPTKWASKQLGIVCVREYKKITLFSPFADATISVYIKNIDTQEVQTYEISILRGDTKDVSTVIGGRGIFTFESDVDICGYHESIIGDFGPIYPASEEVYGVPSGAADAVMLKGGKVKLYTSNGEVHNLGYKNDNQSLTLPVYAGEKYDGKSVKVVTDGLICVRAIADSDGTQMTPFVEKYAMVTHFVLPEDCSYVVFVGDDEGVIVTQFDPNGVQVDQFIVDGGNDEFPSKLKITTNLVAGCKFVCSRPQYGIMELLADTSEVSLYGYNPDVENAYPKTVKTFSEGSLLPLPYIAHLPLVYHMEDVGPNGFREVSTAPPKKYDRGFEFHSKDNYIPIMNNQDAKKFLGEPTEKENLTIALSFLSNSTDGNAEARLVTRDASNYWGIGIEQNAHFPQRLIWWDEGKTFSVIGVINYQWNRVVMTRDVKNNKTKMYLNGELIGESTCGPGKGLPKMVALGNNTEEYIYNSNGLYGFLGMIEDFHMVRGILSEREVKSDYQRFEKLNRQLSFGKKDTNVYQLIER